VRVKGYLESHGVEFDAVNLMDNPAAQAEMRSRGIRALPVVTVGDRHVLGFDLNQIDAALGLKKSSTDIAAAELVARAQRLLAAAVRFARQLPPAKYGTPIPGMEDAKPPFIIPGGHVLVLPDGRPYVPHATNLALFRHIIAHGSKFRRFLRLEATDYAHMGLYAQYGELLPELGLDALCAQVESDRAAIADWWASRAARGTETVLETWMGQQTVRQMLQREVYSLAQHTRQLQAVLQDLGIAPDGPVDPADNAGLNLPARTWD